MAKSVISPAREGGGGGYERNDVPPLAGGGGWGLPRENVRILRSSMCFNAFSCV